MGENTNYLDKLDVAILAKTEHMDNTELKKLKDDYRLFQSAFQAVYNVLLRKGLIIEDPYKYELKISEVETPPNTPFGESEKNEQLSVRLSQFESYLDFLNNYYQFSVDFLTMGRIKRLVALGKYFNFQHFSENSQHVNTRFFAEYVNAVKKGSDNMSVGILNESLSQLEKSAKRIFDVLKSLSDLHRERYKLEFRRLVLPSLKLDRNMVIGQKDETIRRLRNRINEMGIQLPFSQELAEEILNEDFSNDSEILREATLKKIEVKQQDKEIKGPQVNYRNIIIEGAKILIAASFALSDAIRKLEENQALLSSLDRSMLSKIRRALREMMGKKDEAIVHEVEYLDPVSSERKREVLNFSLFVSDAGKRAQALSSMTGRNSPALTRLEESTEDQAYAFFNKSLTDIQNYFRKTAAFEEFFYENLFETELKNRVKSVKTELATIRTAIVKANQKRHEYLSKKEEQEQMIRLGIKNL